MLDQKVVRSMLKKKPFHLEKNPCISWAIIGQIPPFNSFTDSGSLESHFFECHVWSIIFHGKNIFLAGRHNFIKIYFSPIITYKG